MIKAYYKQVNFRNRNESKYLKMIDNRLIIVHFNDITHDVQIRRNKISSLANYVLEPSTEKEFNNKFDLAINVIKSYNDE